MTGAVGVMAVILLETAVGGALVLWATGVYGHVRRGFFLLTGMVLALSAAGAWALTREALLAEPPAPSGTPALGALAVFAALMVAWQVLLVIRDNLVARAVGLAASAAGPVALVLFGVSRGADPLLAVVELALGALFLGSATYGLLLGHWYLVERRLSNDHIVRGARWYIAGVAAGIGAVALSARNPAPSAETASPLFAVPGFSVLLGAGLVAICALIAGFVWKLAREGGRSIQAATGMFYLAVIMAFSAELASKFRFFHG